MAGSEMHYSLARPVLENPLKILLAGSPGRTSQTSIKAALSGVSSGGRLSQARTIISKEPIFFVSPRRATMVRTRAVTLSKPCKIAVL